MGLAERTGRSIHSKAYAHNKTGTAINQLVDLAKASSDGFVLEFPRRFRLLGLVVTAIGVAFFASLFLEGRAAGDWRNIAIGQWLFVRVFILPFGVGLLIWSTQKIVVVQNRIVSLHLGRRRELDRASAYLHKRIKSGVYLKDAKNRKLFLSQFLVPVERLLLEVAERQ